MTKTYVAENSAGNAPAITPFAQNDFVSVRSTIALAIALIVGDHVELGKLPAGCVLSSIKFDHDQIDSNGSPLLAFNLGTLTGEAGDAVNARTNNAEFGSVTVGRTASETTVVSSRIPRLPPQPIDRGIGLTVTAAAATSVIQSGTLTTNKGAWARNTVYATGDYVTIPGGAIMACTTAGTSASGQDSQGKLLAYSPNWNIGKAATTNDGTVVWTCASVVIGMTMSYRASRNQY